MTQSLPRSFEGSNLWMAFLALVMHCKYNPIEGNELTCISTTLRKFEIKRASLDHYQQALVCAPIDSSSSQGHSLRACFHSPPLLADAPYVSVWSVSAFWFLKMRVTDSSLCFTETALDLERDWWTPIHLCQNPSRFSSGPGTTGAHNWKKKLNKKRLAQNLQFSAWIWGNFGTGLRSVEQGWRLERKFSWRRWRLCVSFARFIG